MTITASGLYVTVDVQIDRAIRTQRDPSSRRRVVTITENGSTATAYSDPELEHAIAEVRTEPAERDPQRAVASFYLPPGEYEISVDGAVGDPETIEVGGPIVPADGGDVTSRAPIASPTFTGVAAAPAFSVSGLTGSVAASRYVGATASGAPAAGAHLKGDWVIDQTGKIWICTVAGTPGTWVSASGSSVPGRRYKTGRWYGMDQGGSDGAGAALVLNELLATRLTVYEAKSFDRVGIEVTTLGASSVVRTGIYQDDGDGYPGALLVDWGASPGTFDASTTGQKTITIAQALPAGIYWLAMVAQVAACSVRTKANSTPDWMGFADASNSDRRSYAQSGVSGALPANFTTSVTMSATAPKMYLRAA